MEIFHVQIDIHTHTRMHKHYNRKNNFQLKQQKMQNFADKRRYGN